MTHLLSNLALIGIVLIAAGLSSSTLERAGIPMAAVFLALGALVGPLGLGLVDVGFHDPVLHVLATLGLALVLFSDAVTLRVPELRERWTLVWRVLGPGTLLPAVIIALAAWWLLDVPAAGAAILGAALASTDPVLLRSVFRSPALPAPVRLALRIETGMNDVVLLPIVVLAMLVLRAPASGGVAAHDVVRDVFGLFLLGPLFGALIGWAGITGLVRVRQSVGVRRDLESLYALGLALTAYAAAESVGGSGFVAAFGAGLLVAMQDVELCDCFLEYGEATAEMLLLFTFVSLGTTLMWRGLAELDWRLVLFTCIALGARTVVLYPVLRHAMSDPDRRLASLFGARGLSSLLLVLLPVFAGVPGAERLFTITSVVVLVSIVVHGGGIGLFVRRHRAAEERDVLASAAQTPAPSAAPAPAPVAAASATPLPVLDAPQGTPERITIEEMRALQTSGEPVVLVDARADRNYDPDTIMAAGAVRVRPDDPVRDATVKRLSQRATLVVYCA